MNRHKSTLWVQVTGSLCALMSKKPGTPATPILKRQLKSCRSSNAKRALRLKHQSKCRKGATQITLRSIVAAKCSTTLPTWRSLKLSTQLWTSCLNSARSFMTSADYHCRQWMASFLSTSLRWVAKWMSYCRPFEVLMLSNRITQESWTSTRSQSQWAGSIKTKGLILTSIQRCWPLTKPSRLKASTLLISTCSTLKTMSLVCSAMSARTMPRFVILPFSHCTLKTIPRRLRSWTMSYWHCTTTTCLRIATQETLCTMCARSTRIFQRMIRDYSMKKETSSTTSSRDTPLSDTSAQRKPWHDNVILNNL